MSKNTFLWLITICGFLGGVTFEQSLYKYNPEDVPVMIHGEFLRWRNKHQKNYETTKEYLFRLQNFYENYLRLVELKVGHDTIFYDNDDGEKLAQGIQISPLQELAFDKITIERLNRNGIWRADLGKFADLTKNEFLKGWSGFKWTTFSNPEKIEDTLENPHKLRHAADLQQGVKKPKNWDWRT